MFVSFVDHCSQHWSSLLDLYTAWNSAMRFILLLLLLLLFYLFFYFYFFYFFLFFIFYFILFYFIYLLFFFFVDHCSQHWWSILDLYIAWNRAMRFSFFFFNSFLFIYLFIYYYFPISLLWCCHDFVARASVHQQSANGVLIRSW